jgi:hypothetical protein
VPPGTDALVQQLSLLAPQLVSPAPPLWQLWAVVVCPVQLPPLHVPVAHGAAALQTPAEQVRIEFPEHSVAPGVHCAAPSDPLLPDPPVEPPLLPLLPPLPEPPVSGAPELDPASDPMAPELVPEPPSSSITQTSLAQMSPSLQVPFP